MYFAQFPLFTFNGKLATEIIRRAAILNVIKTNGNAYSFYDVRDGEKPEDIAYKVYGRPNLHYVILLMNDRLSPWYNHWILDQDELWTYAKDKYGASNIHDVHHYETNELSPLGSGIVIPSDYEPGAHVSSVSNIEYEERQNEKLRRIKIPRVEIAVEIDNILKKTLLS